MPIRSIPRQQTEHLIELPETGMGFQLVLARFMDWSEEYLWLVFNSRYFLPAEDPDELMHDLQQLGEAGAETFSQMTTVEQVELKYEAREIAWSDAFVAIKRLVPGDVTLGQADRLVKAQPLVATKVVSRPEVFFRFSPYKNDRRVTRSGNFRPGTHATTFADFQMVPSGFAAVGRYALPSPLSAKYVYPIVTTSSPVKIGTVMPQFGQAGGGVEVFFPDGASARRSKPFTVPSG